MRHYLVSCLTVLLAVGLLAGSVRAEDAEDAVELEPHTDLQLKENAVFETFESKWESDDIDDRLRILRWFGMWRHKKVMKELKGIWLKEDDFELRAVAAQGLGNQKPFAKAAAKILVKGLEDMEKLASREEPEGEEELLQVLEAKALVAGLEAIATLGYKDGWKQLKGFIDHPHDDVAGALMLQWGALKEYRALPVLLDWFHAYPDGYSYSGGSVRVDTGAAGNRDAKAAKAKWKAKFGSRARRARPAAWEKMVLAVEMITGQKFEKAEDLKAWISENKVWLRRQGM